MIQLLKPVLVSVVLLLSASAWGGAEQFNAYITDQTGTKSYVKNVTSFKNKPIRFFTVKHGRAVLDIPVSNIARITAPANDLCQIRLKDNRKFQVRLEGYAWIGENTFGGSFFIAWPNWKQIEFVK